MSKIVTIGGGTGSYRVLSGIKNIPDIFISAIVSMADDGGSTGRLRKELKVSPSGDVRQCLAALTPDQTMHDRMKKRIDTGEWAGHVVGNIFLAGLELITDSFAKGLEIAAKVLQIQGTVLPITLNNAELVVSLADGKIIEGESEIARTNLIPENIKNIYYKNPVKINDKARQAILQADNIIFCPGNFYCSIVPNLIVEGFRQAITETNATLIMIVNLENFKKHTDGWKVSDYVDELERYIGRPVDFILVNNEERKIENDLKEDKRVVESPLLSREPIVVNSADVIERSTVRHDPKKLAAVIGNIVSK